MSAIAERLNALNPGEAIHIGHSYVVLNVAGLRIALDPATETGACAAPFSNLTPTSRAQLPSYRPLIDPAQIPSAEALAANVEVVLYSHAHTDHFNAAVLAKLMAANPQLKVLWPAETPRLLYAPRQALSGFWRQALAWLDKLPWSDRVPDGVREFCATAPPRLRLADTRELADGESVILRESPRVELRAFAVRHPRPLLWVQLPWEAATPPVLGYELLYDDQGARRRLLLIGESSTDPEVLYRIWQAREELVGLFLPVDEWLKAPGVRWLYDLYFHASPQLLALAERLVGDRTTIHGLHHGLWLYALTAAEVELGRRLIVRGAGPQTDDTEVEARLTESRAAREFGWAAIRKLERLIETVSRYPRRGRDGVRLNPLGQAFRIGREAALA